MTRRRHEYHRVRPHKTVDGVALVGSDRRVNSRTVVCPQCKADIGEHCLTRRPGDVHPVRRRMAVRLLNEAL